MAENNSLGGKLVYLQHGGYGGIIDSSFFQAHEIICSDIYLTWGWQINDISNPFIKNFSGKVANILASGNIKAVCNNDYSASRSKVSDFCFVRGLWGKYTSLSMGGMSTKLLFQSIKIALVLQVP